jgi:hypothetical protein
MEPAGSVVRRRGSQVDRHFPAGNPEKPVSRELLHRVSTQVDGQLHEGQCGFTRFTRAWGN